MLLGVLKVKIILDIKVKNSTLLKVGETKKKIFTIKESETFKQKHVLQNKVKLYLREKKHNTCKVTLESFQSLCM